MDKTKNDIILTGIKPTGVPHIGNYFGAIKPTLELSKNAKDTFIFIADYHALNFIKDAKLLKKLSFELACVWLACGGDQPNITMYRQSDIPQVFQLNWILNNVTPKGLLNRAHAYKAVVEENLRLGNDPDYGVNMGLYNYPVLMAADILIMDSSKVPVGQDQKQHLEITNEIVRVFNNTYGNVLVPPECIVQENVQTILGLDGRKMSKSYGNTIEIFCTENELKKKINKIVTNSLMPGEKKDINCALFKLYELFATPDERENMVKLYNEGIGWGEAKKQTFEVANNYLKPMREKYEYYINHPEVVEHRLQSGAKKATEIANNTLLRVKNAIIK